MHRLGIFVISLLFCALSTVTHAEQGSRGRDFYLSFLPNYHDNNGSQRGDSLYVYIVAEQRTSGSIVIRNRSGQSTTVPFTINNPNTIYMRQFAWSGLELLGYNQQGNLSATNDNEIASKASIHITADNDVAVYALNRAYKSSDAALVFPTTSLGTDYRVLSYKSSGRVSNRTATGDYTPSQFCVVATDDNTEVVIHPSTATTASNAAERRVTLQRGEAYLMQSQFSTTNLYNDLSGSDITSNKPVAVFSGHQRSRLPEETTQLESRDCLYEQLIPTSVWGTKYVLTPFAQPIGGSNFGSDLYRVIAAEDGTVISVNGQRVATLKKNAFYEGVLNTGALLDASKKVMVALYKKSSTTDINNPKDGDPFMMIIPPRRQYNTSYRFTNVQVNGVYRQQYITVIVSQADMDSIRLDGRIIKTPFSLVPNSCYAYVTLSMTDGAHTIQSPSPMGLYVYGFGPADSYGYVGGMAFIPDVEDDRLDAGGNRTVCAGSAVNLVARHAWKNIRWTPSTALSCDTCASTVATPTKTTRYVVSGVDSAGCQSSDTVLISVRDIPVNYTLGPDETDGSISSSIGSSFPLAVNAKSDNWDSVGIVSFVATIRTQVGSLLCQDSVVRGEALPDDWSIEIDTLASRKDLGIVVVKARGKTPLNTNGKLFLLIYKAMLGNIIETYPGLEVRSSGLNLNCAHDESRGAFVLLTTCAANLRQVTISINQTQLKSLSPNPATSNTLTIDYSLAFESAVEFQIYSLSGEEVSQVHSGTELAGSHQITADCSMLANGSYVLVMKTPDGVYRSIFTKSF